MEMIPSPQSKLSDNITHQLLPLIQDNCPTVGDSHDTDHTPAHAAVLTRATHTLKTLLNEGAVSVNAQDEDGNTALHLAIRTGAIDAMKTLLESGADDTVANNQNDPPLIMLLRQNDCCDQLAVFLKYPIYLNVKGACGHTPLHVVAERNQTKALDLLWSVIVNKEVSTDELFPQDDKGWTALHTAASHGSHGVLDLLISKAIEDGFSADTVLHLLDSHSNTPLHTAIEYAHITAVEVLLKHGATPSILSGDRLPPFHLACQQNKYNIVVSMVQHCGKEILHNRDVYHHTPLHCCTKNVCNELFLFVLGEGADPNTQDKKGNTPLHIAVAQGSAVKVEHLLNHGADPTIMNSKGYNPFHLSLQYSRGEAFRTLMKSDYTTKLCQIPDTHGNYPVHLAVRRGFAQAIPDIMSVTTTDYKDRHDNNVLHAAAEAGNATSVTYILSQHSSKALLNRLNSEGMTALHLAASNGSVASIQELLDHGAIMHTSYNGDTPFMLACQGGHLEAAVLLYEATLPSKHSASNRDGNNALHLAAQSRSTEVMLMCLDSGIDITLNNFNKSFFDLVLESPDADIVIALLNHDRWEECLDHCSPQLPHPVLRIIKDVPEALQVVLDRSTTSCSNLSREDPDWWEEFNFKYITLSKTNTPPKQQTISSIESEITPTTVRAITSQTLSRKNSFAVLFHLIKYRHQLYLTHPVIETFIRLKWRKYGRPYYYLKLLLFLLLAIMLSVFIGVTPPPPQIIPEGNETNQTSFVNPSTVFRYVTIAFALPNLLIWLIDMYIVGLDALKHFVSEFSHWIYGLTVLLSLIFTIPWEGLDILYWEVGALAVFLAWITVTLNLQLFNVVGIFVSMLLAVTRNVFSVLLVSILIFFAFTFPLHILLATVRDFTYDNFGTAFFSVLASLHGELDYRNFNLLELMGEIRYSFFTFFFLSLAAIIMPIVVINLLIGLAVGDIARVQKEAVLSLRRTEVRAIHALDQKLPHPILKRLEFHSYREYPNKSFSKKLRRMINNLWNDDMNDQTVHSQRKEMSLPKHLRNKFFELEDSLAKMAVQQSRQQEALLRIEETLKLILDKQN